MSVIRLEIVTNIPAPYRVPVYNRLAATDGIDLHVVYAARREPDRAWDLPAMDHSHQFLIERSVRRTGRVVHHNPDVWPALSAFSPNVVLTNGFNPTHLYAFFWTRVNSVAHVAMTDGTVVSEAGLSVVHRVVRKWVYRRSRSFVAASEGATALFRTYGVSASRIHFSPLCANTSVTWDGVAACSPGLDLLFSGRLVAVKNPLFALDVADGVARRLGRRVSLGILGDGPLRDMVLAKATELTARVELRAPGHVDQARIPGWFASARVFLFPTSWDPWGVVANEACEAGVPTIISPFAGAAGELIRNGENGYVRPLNLTEWIDAACELLTDSALRDRMSAHARQAASRYTFDNAARGIADAARAAHPSVPDGT